MLGSVPELQLVVETAWRGGFCPEGVNPEARGGMGGPGRPLEGREVCRHSVSVVLVLGIIREKVTQMSAWLVNLQLFF